MTIFIIFAPKRRKIDLKYEEVENVAFLFKEVFSLLWCGPRPTIGSLYHESFLSPISLIVLLKVAFGKKIPMSFTWALRSQQSNVANFRCQKVHATFFRGLCSGAIFSQTG